MSNINTWDEFEFWDSGEWQVIEERLDELDSKGVGYNPKREDLFAAMDAVPFDKVQVAILGQDPYPTPEHASGIAFSIPSTEKKFPPTLVNIFKEYTDDLHYPFPTHGCLLHWCRQGVFLWNVIPTCYSYSPGSHRNWVEWYFLNKEIVFRLAQRGVILVALGGVANQYLDDISPDVVTFSYSHPSPLGAKKGQNPFLGSRLFSTINSKLCEQKKQAIDWRLD